MQNKVKLGEVHESSRFGVYLVKDFAVCYQFCGLYPIIYAW
jgi:hypothetical protein